LRDASVALTLPMIGLGALGLTGCAKDNVLFARSTVNKNSLGSWNFAIGFALMIGGLLMTMRWR